MGGGSNLALRIKYEEEMAEREFADLSRKRSGSRGRQRPFLALRRSEDPITGMLAFLKENDSSPSRFRSRTEPVEALALMRAT